MRILIYSYNYYPEPIGIAPLMTELAEGLVKRGHQVRVVTGMPNYPQRLIYEPYRGKFYYTEERNGVIVQRSYLRIDGPHPTLIDRLLLDGTFVTTSTLQAFRGWRPEIIFATVPPLPICVPVTLYAGLRACPIVLNVQDIVSEAAVRVGLVRKDGLLIRIADALEKFAYRTATQISVIADGFAEKLLSQGVPAHKIVYIPNWVDVNFIRPLPKENNSFRKAHQLIGKFVVLYSGNIALTQGLQTVVKAAARLKHIPEIAFVIVGESTALGELQKDCNVYKATNVKLLPFEPREKLPEMLAAADVGLVVQKRRVTNFNMPSKIQLILASGRAIVASVPETGTAIKIVKQSGAGIAVAPEDPQALADAIQELFYNPAQVEALGQRGRKYAIEHYSFEDALNQYEALFTAVAANRVPLLEPFPK
ncbi:MAG: glycosyltransferase family 4 protein [Actinomycetota bacterium]